MASYHFNLLYASRDENEGAGLLWDVRLFLGLAGCSIFLGLILVWLLTRMEDGASEVAFHCFGRLFGQRMPGKYMADAAKTTEPTISTSASRPATAAAAPAPATTTTIETEAASTGATPAATATTQAAETTTNPTSHQLAEKKPTWTDSTRLILATILLVSFYLNLFLFLSIMVSKVAPVIKDEKGFDSLEDFFGQPQGNIMDFGMLEVRS